MGIINYAKLNIREDIRKNFLYVFAIAISFCIIIITMNCFYNTSYYTEGGLSEGVLDGVVDPQLELFLKMPHLLQGQNFLILFLMVALYTYYCNYQFIKSKAKEFAFFTINGSTLGDRLKYIMYENFVFFAIGGPIGAILGFISVPFVNLMMYKINNTSGGLFTINIEVVLGALLIFAFELFIICALNLGDIYRKEPAELISVNKTKSLMDSRVFKIPSIIYLILYLFPLIYVIMYFSMEGAEYGAFVSAFIAVAGLYGVLKYFVPKLYVALSKKSITYKGMRKVYIGNFVASLRNSASFFIALVLALLYYSMNAVNYSIVPGAQSSAFFCYIITSFLVGTALYYQYTVQVDSKIKEYNQLKVLGYSESEISEVIFKENLMFFTIGSLLPLLILMCNYILFIKGGYFSVVFSILLVACAIVPFVALGIFATNFNKKRILNELFGGK